MNQPPLAHFQEDREARLHHRKSDRRTYLVALPVVAAVVGVALLGVLGSKVAPDDKDRPAASAAIAVASGSPSPAHTLQSDNAAPSLIDIPGLTSMPASKGDALTEDLPPDTLPLDADGGNFLYGSGPNLFVVTAARTTVSVGQAHSCGQIERAAISGLNVIYSEIVPAGYSGDGSSGCPPLVGVDALDWYVSVADFTGLTHLIAKGTYAVPPGAGPASAAPSVAITDVTYGYSRPDWTGKSGMVEVHALADDSLVFRSEALALPVEAYLSVGRLVVVSSGPLAANNPDVPVSVWSTTEWSRPLDAVGLTAGAVALSRDGQRLAFAGCNKVGDGLECTSLDTFAPDVHWSQQLPTAAAYVSVDSGSNSRFKATAWISSAPDGTPYIGVATDVVDNRVALTGPDRPMWICIQDDTLIWLSLTPDGSTSLTRLDLQSVLQAT